MTQLRGQIGYVLQDVWVSDTEARIQLAHEDPLLADVELTIRVSDAGTLEVFVHGNGYPNWRRLFPSVDAV